MPHPWDLDWVWRYSVNAFNAQRASLLQLQCVAKGLFGSEAASYAQADLDELAALVELRAVAQRVPHP